MNVIERIFRPINFYTAAMLAIFTATSFVAAHAQIMEGPTKTPAPPFVCSNETLNGRFATRGSGFAPANPMDPTSPLVPFANVSLMTFGGDGTLTNSATNSLNGIIIPGTAVGTYELNPDCSGTLALGALPGVLTFNIVVAERGTAFYMISTTRSVVTVEGKRVQ